MLSKVSRFAVLGIALWLSACAHGGEVPVGTPDGPQGTPGLDGARVGKLFDCFVALQRQSPEALYWVSPLKEVEGYYLTTEFQHQPSASTAAMRW